MKKIVCLFMTVMIIFVIFFTIDSNAAELNNIAITTSEGVVHPGNTVSLTITFGDPLGAYTFDIAYDKNLLDFVNTSEGTTSNIATGVRDVWFDSSGGTNPSNSLTLTFKAKEGNNQSVPTNFAVTGTGITNPDETVVYDDILTPIDIDFIIEPVYIPYTISLSYTDTILPNEEKAMTIGIDSAMGRYYDNVRLTADVIGPDGSVSKLLGIDNLGKEYDLIKDGLGGPTGYSIGGASFTQQFNYKALFDKEGDYTITFKLIDIGGNELISQSSYTLRVGTITPVVPEAPKQEQTPETLPVVLPKTGSNAIIIVCVFSMLALIGYILFKKEK